jgi:hypothetical protein
MLNYLRITNLGVGVILLYKREIGVGENCFMNSCSLVSIRG